MKTLLAATATTPGGRWVYPLLLAMQTLGVSVLYWKALPMYRQLVVDPGFYAQGEETLGWSLLSITLIQVGFWTRYYARPATTQFVNALAGHLVLFLSELVFIPAAVAFSFVFISQELGNQMPPLRYIVLLGGLFSLFCYMEELQQLGRCLLGRFRSTNGD